MSGDLGSKQLPRTKVFFRWACSDAAHDEEVRVVGDCEELGLWQPAGGVVLQRSGLHPSCWTSPAVSLSMGVPVHYKYVVCNAKLGAKPPRWEPQEDNRTAVPTGRHHVLEDDGGRHRHVEVRPARRYGTEVDDLDHGMLNLEAQSRCASVSTLPASASLGPMSPKPTGAGGSPNAASPTTLAPSPTSASDNGSQSQISQVMPKLQSFENRRRREEELEMLTSDDKVICIFRTLPFRVARKGEGWEVIADKDVLTFKVVSLLHMSLKALPESERTFELKFVGDPGVYTSDPEEQRQITEVLAPYSCVPVFMDQTLVEQGLEFCHAFLWPVMHNMKVFDDETLLISEDGTEAEKQKFDEASWRTYQKLNRAYVEAAEPHVRAESLVWVHDFYLLLVPRYLQIKKRTSVGFFLHSAFPSSEVLLCMPCREEILQSLLSCKVVTFQIFEYARHFLTCCQSLLNTTYSFQGTGVLHIEHEGDSTVVRSDHFVLPYGTLQERVKTKEVVEAAARIRKPFGDKIVFGAIDGDQPFSGMILKMRAFHKFLSECPQHQNRVGLLQHVLPRRTADGAESELVREMKRLAAETNKMVGQPGQPGSSMIVTVGDLETDERLGTMLAVDVLLDTSINDGLNLHPFLFCCAHEKEVLRRELDVESPAYEATPKGTMIVSEFSGCSSVLTGAVKVNPWHTQAVMDAMHSVVTMEAVEQDRRFRQDHSYISTQALPRWLQTNLAEIKKARATQTGPVRGLGAGAQLLLMESGFRHLSDEAVLKDYRQARVRAIFLDNEGTLAPDARNMLRPYSAQEQLGREGRAPDPQVLECLQQLAADRANTVVVISGRNRPTLEQWFGSVEGLGLCAEHGFDYKLPAKLNSGKTEWMCQADGVKDDDWKTIVFELMKQYVKRVQGSVVEYKGSAITWNYRKVGAQQLAKEIALELTRFLDPKEGLMHGYPVQVVSGKGYVEVKRSDVDKGNTVSRILKHMRGSLGSIDFVLCIGDDRSDEDMFQVVNTFSKDPSIFDEEGGMMSSPRDQHSPKSRKSEAWSGSGFRVPPLSKKGSVSLEEFNAADAESGTRYYTVTVGKKPSKALYYVKDPCEVSKLLQKLALQTKAANLSRYQSMPMLCHQESYSSEED